jgi:hypothetical protein
LQYANDKSYNAFNKKLIEEIKNNNSEWAHNFYAVTNNDYFSYNYNNYLFKYEKQLLNKSYLINLINFYKSSLKTNIFNSNNIAEIKKRYQQQAFNHIYNIINVYRMFLNYKGKHIKYYNVNNFLFKKDFENIPNCDIIIENIYKYLWIVKKLSIYCEDNNIPYSIHKYNIVDIDFLNDISNQEIILNKCLLSILNYMERNL